VEAGLRKAILALCSISSLITLNSANAADNGDWTYGLVDDLHERQMRAELLLSSTGER
jgi:hypothetical protein